MTHPAVFRPLQARFLTFPVAPAATTFSSARVHKEMCA